MKILIIFVALFIGTNLSGQTGNKEINKIIHKYKDDEESAQFIIEIHETQPELLKDFQYEFPILYSFAEELFEEETFDDALVIFHYLEDEINKLNDPEFNEYIFMFHAKKLLYYYEEELNTEAKKEFGIIKEIIKNREDSTSPEMIEYQSIYEHLLAEQEKELIDKKIRRVERKAKRAEKEAVANIEEEEDAEYDRLMEQSMRIINATQSISENQKKLEDELHFEDYKLNLKSDVGQSHKIMDNFNSRVINYANGITFSELNFTIAKLVDALSYNIEFVNSNYSKNDKLVVSLFNQVTSLNDIRNRHKIALAYALNQADKVQSERWQNECAVSPLTQSREDMFSGLVENMEAMADCAKLERKIYDSQELKPIKGYEFDEIKSALKDQDVLLIFNRIKLINGSVSYGVLITDNKSKHPKWILLDCPIDIEVEGFDVYLKALKAKNDDRAYQYFFSQIAPHLKNAKRIFILSDGIYHKINLSTLYDPQSMMYLFDKYKIIYIRDVGELKDKDIYVEKGEKLSLIGVSQFQEKSKNQNLKKFSFPDLPNVKKEIDVIYDMLNSEYQVDMSIDENNTISIIDKLKNPSVFHISTHGYFLPRFTFSDEDGPIEDDFVVNESSDSIINVEEMMGNEDGLFDVQIFNSHISKIDPFLQSGLILDNGDYMSSNVISGLNLSETKLVTLSACHSNRGMLLSGQSSFGVKNSLLMSGVDYVLASTHKVGDYETLEFMKYFYNKLSQQHSILDSYNSAVDYIKSEHPIIAPSSPYIWGAFTLERGYSDY